MAILLNLVLLKTLEFRTKTFRVVSKPGLGQLKVVSTTHHQVTMKSRTKCHHAAIFIPMLVTYMIVYNYLHFNVSNLYDCLQLSSLQC